MLNRTRLPTLWPITSQMCSIVFKSGGRDGYGRTFIRLAWRRALVARLVCEGAPSWLISSFHCSVVGVCVLEWGFRFDTSRHSGYPLPQYIVFFVFGEIPPQITTDPLWKGITANILCVLFRFCLLKIINGRPRECHNKKVQPIPSTKRKRNRHETETTKLHVNNSRKTSSHFPNRGSWSTTAYNK